jgi:hypothetical protein
MTAVVDLRPLDAVLTYHTDGFRSGVARFNELLAARLGVPLLRIDGDLTSVSCPLLSFKVGELPKIDAAAFDRLLQSKPWPWEVYLHDFCDLELERRMVAHAQRVHCGNAEIRAAVAELSPALDELWTPGLIVDDREFPVADITIFSFGMAHKIRADMFARLRALLEASGRSYALYVSAANHETVSFRDAEIVFHEMQSLFPDRMYFLGNLSDVAVADWLRRTTFFAAFFAGGVRANNTSVAAAMERGAVVVTNIDEYSPTEFVHGENVLDVSLLDSLTLTPDTLRSLSEHARALARGRGWDELVRALSRMGR